MTQKKKLILAVKILVSVGLLGFLYRRVPFAEVAGQLGGANLALLPAIFALLLFNTAISAYKWQALLRADNISIPLGRLIGTYLIGSFFNIFLPSNIGGDAYRIYNVAKTSSNSASSFSSVLADRLSGFLALVILAVLASFFVIGPTHNVAILALPAAVGIALAIVIWALCRGTPVRAALRFTPINRWPAAAGFVDRCLETFAQYRRRPAMAAKILAISFVFQACAILCVYLMALSLKGRVPFIYFCAFVPIITLAEAIPLSVYGVGIRDAAYVFLFTLVGMSQVEARALPLLYLLITVAYSLVGGILLAFRVFRSAEPKPEPASASARTATGVDRKGTWAVVLLTLAVWALFSWPLPRHFFSSIPSSSRNVEAHHRRNMIAGDHLQLLYHFWLAGDMLAGQTPLFHNLYEFNTGNDAERREPGAYYLPFSLIYAMAAPLGGRAFGWNVAGLFSILAGGLFLWRLIRRYTSDPWSALLGVIVGIAFPYRWITLLGGSPTGFAIALVPLLLLGLDKAVRDDSVGGGVLAGITLVLCYCSDLHVFFFAALCMPFWCLVALVNKHDFPWRNSGAYRSLALALAPAFVFGLIALALSRLAAKELSTASLAGGWSLGETAAYTPRPRGFFGWGNLGISNQIYAGYTVAVLLAAGLVAALRQAAGAPREHARRAVTLLLLVAAALGVAALSVGVYGPHGGLLFRACRRLIPHYDMVRQAAKITCLAPTLLALAVALSAEAMFGSVRSRLWRRLALGAAAALLLVEYRCQISPTICGIETRQAAYAAVADDAGPTGTPRALALPLWPGNSHWSSLSQHHASLYRIRMINGYRPAVQQNYIEHIFRRFESVNQGVLSDSQIEELLDRGVEYLLLYEDVFPEKVSPFPVILTLKRLLNHPRLALLKQGESIWAFKILREPLDRPEQLASCRQLLPARRWEFERFAAVAPTATPDAHAAGGAYAALTAGPTTIPVRLRAPVADAPRLRWLFRLRGAGRLDVVTRTGDAEPDEQQLNVTAANWTWMEIPIRTDRSFFDLGVDVSCSTGALDLDVLLLAAGDWHQPKVGEVVEFAPACFFHAGYTDRHGSVSWRADREPDRVILYGPLLPLDKGTYEVTLALETAAAPGSVLARLRVRSEGQEGEWVPVSPGAPAVASFEQTSTLPVSLELWYSRLADVTIRHIALRKKQ